MPRASSAKRKPRRPAEPICGFEFDDEVCRKRGSHYCVPRAAKVRAFFHEILVHTKGRFARKPFILAEWQWAEIIGPIFGLVRWDPHLLRYVRRIRIVWIELGRKNGKSEILAGIALYLLIGDGEESAEIYGAAKDRPQARKVWDVALRMLELSPTLNELLAAGTIKVNKQEKKIVYEPTGSYYEIVTADAAGELGHNPHGIVFDEILAQASGDLWTALKTAMGTREQPLMVAATTAGNDPSAFVAQEHAYCLKVAEDPDLDPARHVFIRNTPADADPWDEANWTYANPALGDFLNIQALRDDALEARNNPVKENAFRQFRLNQWVKQHTRWMPMTVWDASAGMVKPESLKAKTCYAALHLTSTTDVVSWVLDFPREDQLHDALFRFFIPKDRMADLSARTDGQADVWAREGFLTVTDGDLIDYSAIRSQIDKDAALFDIEEVAYHRWGMTQLATELDDAGLTVVPVTTGIASISAATKEWDRLVRLQKWIHGGNPVMRWMVDNISIRMDSEENIKIDPKASKDTVTGPIAAVMALDRFLRSTSVDLESMLH